MPVEAFSEHCFLLKGLCQNSPLLIPLVLPLGLIHPPTVRAVPGLSSRIDQDGKPPTFFGHWTGLEPGCAQCLAKASGHVLMESDRCGIID